MNKRAMLAFVLMVVFVQISTWSVVHGFSTDQKALLVVELALLAPLIFAQNTGGLVATLFLTLMAWRFWALFVPLSWGASQLIHSIAGLFVEFLGEGFGVSAEGFRIMGNLVVPDPTKTASFALSIFVTLYFLLTLIESGFRCACKELASVIPFGVIWCTIRWIALAALLGWWKPDLVVWAWHLFWGIGLTISLLPLAFAGTRRTPPLEAGFSVGIGRLWFVLLIALGFCQFFEPGGSTPRPSRVLVLESHSNWEALHLRPEDRLNATLSENTYFPFSLLLADQASLTIAIGDSKENQAAYSRLGFPSPVFSVSLLDPARFDLVILKCITRPFSAEEKKALWAYVENGGTIWAIGEHTDVFFMNTWLNDFLGQAGVALRSDGICDHRGRWLVTGGPLHASFGPAPGPGLYMWATGASISGGNILFPLAVSSPDTFSDRWATKNVNFFGKLEPDAGHLYGPFMLAGVLNFGKGKVIVHGDSTNFNASMLSTPGKWGLIARVLAASTSSGMVLWLRFAAEFLFALFTGHLLGLAIRSKNNRYLFVSLLALSAGILGPFIATGYQPEIPTQAQFSSPILAVDYSLSPETPLSFGHQQEVTASGSLDRMLVQLHLEGTHLISATSRPGQLLEPRIQGLLLVDPARDLASSDQDALHQWLQQGGKLFLLTRGKPGGPLRSLLLRSGVTESVSGSSNPGEFPDLEFPAVQTAQERGDWFKEFPVGQGRIYLMENFPLFARNSQDYLFLARLISDKLRRN